ncbi:MAG: phosphatidylglycerol lysyltransferase domain-containing protein [Treponema sp.]|nr:phosphatidylglycerol lysyltransferase domain-containing protein [Treponema sp.]
MTTIPCYPDFSVLDIKHKESLHPRLSLTPDGVSEFTFSGLYLFRNKYKYKISRQAPLPSGEEGGFIISGEQNTAQGKKTFFMTPCCAPDFKTLDSLFSSNDYWKNIPESVLSPVKEKLEERGFIITEDRDNFDYLYYRKDLAELAGKKYHKKKNHVNNFLSTYPNHEQRSMNENLIPAAFKVLEQWRQDSLIKNDNEDGDYAAAKEALDLFNLLALKGSVFFIDGKPAAFCLGESIARGKMFVTHFEKAISSYRGIYQFVNQAFAASLPGFFTLINREQDLGNEGMRQSKMTYRPCDFVRKYTVKMNA